MILLKTISIILMIFILAAALYCQDNKVEITEASGITRLGDKLLIVSDDTPGAYYEYDIPKSNYDIIPIDPAKTRKVKLPGAELADDLEAIGVTGDGRVLVLSELLHSLVGKKKPGSDHYSIIAYYDKSYTEFGNRGLEGLAIKDNGDGSYKIAVLWEGGYPISAIVPDEMKECADAKALKPRILIHEFPVDDKQEAQEFSLDVPILDNMSRGQRYRASAIAWDDYRIDQNSQECLIALLQSENCPPHNSDEKVSYKYKILQRFNLNGQPVGNPIDLTVYAKKTINGLSDGFYESIGPEMAEHIKKAFKSLEKNNWENVNWEGMGWFEKGKSLILIFDKHPKDPPFAMVLHLPENW